MTTFLGVLHSDPKLEAFVIQTLSVCVRPEEPDQKNFEINLLTAFGFGLALTNLDKLWITFAKPLIYNGFSGYSQNRSECYKGNFPLVGCNMPAKSEA